MLINISSLLISIFFSISVIELKIPVSRNSIGNYLFILIYLVILVFFIVKRVNRSVINYKGKKNFILILLILAAFASIFTFTNINSRKKLDIKIISLDDKNDSSLGKEVWVSKVTADNNKIQFQYDQNWVVKDDMLLSNNKKPAEIKWTGFSQSNIKIYMVSHKWSGKVKIKIGNEEFKKDLYSENGKTGVFTYNIVSNKSNYDAYYRFIMVYVLLLIVSGLFIIGFNKSEYTRPRIITIEDTTMLKGIAIILIIVSHLRLTKVISLPPYLNYLGDWGVVIFLLLSGYGLARSYKFKGIKKSFFLDRVRKVVIPYSIVTAIWIIVDKGLYGKTYDIKNTILALIGMDFSRSIDVTMWYITFILLWYIIFYFIFKIKVNNKFKVIVLIVFSMMFRYFNIFNFLNKMHIQWQFHAFVFPIGVIVGLYFERMCKYVEKINCSILNLLKYIIPIAIILKLINNITNPETYFLVNISVALIIIFLVKDLTKVINKISIVKFIGTISFEVYLIHFSFMTRINIFNLKLNIFIQMIIYILILISLGSLLKVMTRRLSYKLK